MPELPREIEVLVEVPRGGRVKRRSDGRFGYLSPFASPFNYGCVPGTTAPDGEPLDALVLGPALPRGTVRRWPVHGVVRFLDAGLVDDKLVCGPEPPTAADLAAIDRFFRRYALVKAAIGRWRGAGPTRFLGWERR